MSSITMAKISTCVLSSLNVVTTLVSLAAVGWSIRIHFLKPETASHCQHTLETVLLVAGLALLAISLLGICGTCFGVRSFLYLYLLVLIIIIVGWVVLSGFVLTVTHKGAGKVVSQVGVADNHLGDFSHWLRDHVVGGKTWVQIRSCLRDAKVCRGLEKTTSDHHGFREVIYPIQFGCCKPPEDCGFKQQVKVNGTQMMKMASSNEDCSRWSNDPLKLCYDCDTCKASVLYDIRNSWRQVAIANAVIICFLFIVFSFGCFARREINKGGPGLTHRQSGHA